MIENVNCIKDVKELAGFIITALCDADFRANLDGVPDVLEVDKSSFNTDDFINMLESHKDVVVDVIPSNIQNDSMLFIELAVKGDLKVTHDHLTKLAAIAA